MLTWMTSHRCERACAVGEHGHQPPGTGAAPFSWEPDEVEPLPSGTLAHSSGPVRDASGKPVARFNSIWRLEAPGVWRVIFDKGSPLPPTRTPP
jgi:hypothetical protein